MRRLILGVFVLIGFGCSGLAGERGQGPLLSGEARNAGPGAEVLRPKGPLAMKEAQEYVLALVNRDRQSEGLEPLSWDPIAAKAGQRHAEDMAKNGFTAHWGTDGSVPEERHSEAGGEAMVQENAACYFDGVERELDKNPLFDPSELEKIQSAFFNEEPPHDGHRRAILTPWHNRFGVGLAKAKGVKTPCMAQELTSHYGSYSKLPDSAKIGDKIRVSGEIHAPAAIRGVGIARIDMPQAMAAEQLNRTSSYPVPPPFATYFPEGFVTPIPLEVDGNRFSITVPLDDAKKPGRYEVSVWGSVPGSKDLVMLSLRTLKVGAHR